MARYILIDNASGYIWGDTAALDVPADATPIDAARALDASLGVTGRIYLQTSATVGTRPAANATAYWIHEAGPAFPPVQDGQDAATIRAVERDCPLVAIVHVTEADVEG